MRLLLTFQYSEIGFTGTIHEFSTKFLTNLLSYYGSAANKYGAKKDKDYNEIIRTKSLDYAYKSITFGTFGAFGSGTWDVIERACDPRRRSAAPKAR